MCDDATASELEEEIRRSIVYNEPRVNLRDVTVKALSEQNEFQIEVVYVIIGLDRTFTFETILVPTR